VPGYEFVELLLHSPHWSQPPLSDGNQAKIVANPSGVAYEHQARTFRMPNRQTLMMFPRLPVEFISTFGKSTEIQIDRNTETIVRLGFRQADRVVAALQACISSALLEWEVDEVLLNRLRSRPVQTRFWMTSDAYPESALRNDQAGQVVVRLSISESGRITDCDVVASSGHESLDEGTCRAALDRGRYSPAIDADGQPVAVQIIEVAKFEIMS
jgi:TonB family protein